MKIIKLFGALALLLSLTFGCGDGSEENSELEARNLAQLNLKNPKSLKHLATNPINAHKFNKSRYQKRDRVVYSSAIARKPLRRDIKCSNDGRLCFECYYKSNGELLYCDVWILPKLKLIRH
jgi:hypothetical protein